MKLGAFQKSRNSFFFLQHFHFSGCFWFFLWQRHNLVMRTVSQLWWFFLPLMKQIIQFFFFKIMKLKCLFSMWVFSKSPKSFLINYISIFQKKDTNLEIFFQVKRYRTEFISEHFVYWYGPNQLPTNNQYKSLIIY